MIIGLDTRIQTTEYNVVSDKISKSFKIGVVSDTHSCKYKEEQQEIYNYLKAEKVDLIFMTGDIIDDVLPMNQGFKTIENFSELAPTFYVTGNHEIWTGDHEGINDRISKLGIEVLDGKIKDIEVNGENIRIMGIDDPYVGEDYYSQIEGLINSNTNNLTLLLAHRPERIEDYKEIGADFIFSGHAHGGQWRIPIILKRGLLAPNQGFFPKYTVGVNDIGNQQELIVSRGLSRESTKIPRFYNRPELVIVNIGGDGNDKED